MDALTDLCPLDRCRAGYHFCPKKEWPGMNCCDVERDCICDNYCGNLKPSNGVCSYHVTFGKWWCVPSLTKNALLGSGSYTKLAEAIQVLNSDGKGGYDNRKMVCEMSDAGVLHDANTITWNGKTQGGGPANGFDKFWAGWGDINKMNVLCEAKCSKPPTLPVLSQANIVPTCTSFHALSYPGDSMRVISDGKCGVWTCEEGGTYDINECPVTPVKEL